MTFCQHCKGEFQDNNFAIADGGHIHAKCGQVTMTMKTHGERRTWMESHGWRQASAPFRTVDIKGLGNCARFEEQNEPQRGLWMAISTGVSLLDGPRDEAMTFEQLQAWIDGTEAKKPLQGQKSLFGDDE